MLDQVGNPKDRFSQNEAHIQFYTEKRPITCNPATLQGVKCRMVLVVKFFLFLKFFLFALLLLHAFVT